MPSYTNLVEDDLTVVSMSRIRWTVFDTKSTGLVISDAALSGFRTKAFDALTIGEQLAYRTRPLLADALTIVDAVRFKYLPVTRVADGLSIRDASYIPLTQKVSDGLTIGDVDKIVWAVRIADSISVGEAVHVTQTTRNKVVDQLLIADTAHAQPRSTWSDAATIGDETRTLLRSQARAQDNLGITDVANFPSRHYNRVADTISIADQARTRLDIISQVADYVLIEDAASGGGVGGAWRTHAELMAMSRYTNFPFNSMAVVGGRLMAAGPGGLYVLDGSDDVGADIDAVIRHDINDDVVDQRSGEMKSDPHFKRPRWAYVSYQSNGQLQMNLGYVDDNGNEQTLSFAMPQRAANQFVTGRMELARGIRSRYLRPEFVNVDGAQFSMNDAKLVVDSVQRNI
jgi:hypothetical protein